MPRSTQASGHVVLVPVWDADALTRFGDQLRAEVVRALREGYAEAVGSPLPTDDTPSDQGETAADQRR